MASIAPGQSFGLFIPTTRVLSPTVIDQVGIQSVLVWLSQDINSISLSLNAKTSGTYSQSEFLDGNAWFPITTGTKAASYTQRGEFRCVIDFGALPNAGAKSVAHNLDTTNWRIVDIYAGATNPIAPSFIPIPFASPTLNLNISLEADATNVTITTGVNRTAYTTCYVVLEYLKS
jgi:hypothetical protein